jgi:hypothetical protein
VQTVPQAGWASIKNGRFRPAGRSPVTETQLERLLKLAEIKMIRNRAKPEQYHSLHQSTPGRRPLKLKYINQFDRNFIP